MKSNNYITPDARTIVVNPKSDILTGSPAYSLNDWDTEDEDIF